MSKLLINLSFLIPQATGISTYTNNLLPYLSELNPTLLVGNDIPHFNCHNIAQNMTADFGTRGHLHRLSWTQFKLPQIYDQLKGELLFSPVTEAPLGRGCRFIVMVHDFIPLRFPDWRSPLTYYHRYYIPIVLEQAVHIICNSQSTLIDIIDFCHIPANKITAIPLAFNTKKFYVLDLPQQNYFLYIGRHDRYKNLRRLIQAFALVSKDYELWIGGTNDRRYTPELETLVRELNLTDRVKFLGYVPEANLTTLLNQAIGLVFPSLWEGFGLPILEAMACGTPVITSNISALPEISGDAALLVDPYNVNSIAQGMIDLTRSVTLRQELKELGLARAKKFSWETTGRLTAKVLEKYL